jgi:flagellar motor switch protein FliM
MQVEGQGKFLGRLGQFRGNRSIQVTRKLKQEPAPPDAKGGGK